MGREVRGRAVRILDKYLLKSFFTFFLLGLGVIAAIFMVISVLDTLSFYFVSRQSPISRMVLLYLYEEPAILYMAMPLAVLLSFCIALGLLEQCREIVAIKAAGISLFRLSLPLLIASAGISIVMYYMGNTLVPLANRKATEMKEILKNKSHLGYYSGEYIWYAEENGKGRLRIFQVDGVDRQEYKAKGIRIYEFDPDLKLERELYAAGGEYVKKKWQLRDVHYWNYKNEQELYRHLKKLAADLGDPRNLLLTMRGPEHMTSKKLRKSLDRLGFNERDYRVELRLRQALPFAAIIMALLAVPFGFRPSRKSSLARNLLFAVVIGFAYFAIMGVSISLAKNGTFPPAFGAWVANVLFGLMGILFFTGTRQ